MPRIKHFIWHILTKAVTTNEALFRRKCAPNPFCPICVDVVETIEHALLLYPWAKFAWFSCPLGILVNEYNIRRIETWIEEGLLSNKEEDIHVYVATHLWNIWKARCKWVFEKVEPSPHQVVMVTNKLITEQLNLQHNTSLNTLTLVQRKKFCWKKPPYGCVKINRDEAFIKHKKQGGVGVVCREDEGKFLGGWADMINAESPFHAKLMALSKVVI